MRSFFTRRGGWLVLGGLVIVLAACGPAKASIAPTATGQPTARANTGVPAPRFQTQTQMNVAYGPLAAEVLDLCTPKGATGTLPGVVIIHGGGWSAGDQHQDDGLCAIFAGQGVIAATLNYRLAPAAIWPAQLVDVQLAIRWLHAQAAALHLDPRRLCAWGDSAGGQLALFAGLLTTIHPGDEAGLLANEPTATPTCIVDLYGPTDLTGLSGTQTQIAILDNLFGNVTPAQNPAIYRDASPLFLVSAASPPMLIIQGTQDTLVPPAQSQALLQALQRAHVAARLIPYTGGHALSGLTQDQKIALLVQGLQFVVQQTGG